MRSQYQYVELVGPVLVPSAPAYNPAVLDWLPDEVNVFRVPPTRRTLTVVRFATPVTMSVLDWIPKGIQPARQIKAPARIGLFYLDPITPVPPLYNPVNLEWLPVSRQPGRKISPNYILASVHNLEPLPNPIPSVTTRLPLTGVGG